VEGGWVAILLIALSGLGPVVQKLVKTNLECFKSLLSCGWGLAVKDGGGSCRKEKSSY